LSDLILKQKGVGCKDVPRETKRAKLFWAKLFIRNRAKAAPPRAAAEIRAPRRTSERSAIQIGTKGPANSGNHNYRN